MTTLPQPNTSHRRAILEAAQDLALAGVRVFPVHGVREARAGDGRVELRCTCGNPACANPAKHPVGGLVPHGHNDATTDPARVVRWFGGAGTAGDVVWNLGVATGRGLVVVDADVKVAHAGLPSGLEVLDAFEEWTAGVQLPATRTARTGSGGLHLWYAVDANLRVSARNRVLPGVDVKGDGGYVLAAPSRHISGGAYAWLDETTAIAALVTSEAVGGPLVAWLLTAKGGRYATRRAADGEATIPDAYDFAAIIAGPGCPPGHRDYFVNDLCFRLRRSGATLDAAAEALRYEWLRMAQPAGDEFTWDACLYKLRRVWQDVQPEDVTDLPAWRPPGAARVQGAAGNAAGEPDGPELAQRLTRALDVLERPDLTFHRSDTGNGARFAQRMRETLRYCTGEGAWYLWDGARWAPDALNRALHLTTEVIRDLYVEAAQADGDERERLENWARTSEALARRRAMLDAAAAEPGVAVPPDALDADPWLLVVANGTLDLRAGTLRASEPTDLNTRAASVAYDPAAACPLWDEHVRLVTGGDASLAAWLRRAVGYTLTGSTGEHKVFFLQGGGSNGKSTFTDVVARILGDYATRADESLITGSGGHPTQLADLRGARLIVVDETDRAKKLAEARIKMMTGREIKARYMRQDFFSYTPRFKLWVSGNHKPEIRGADDGIWRRLQLVPFTATLGADRKILDYDEVLLGEASGILNWALEGLRDWLNVGSLGEPDVVRRATREYRDEEDTIGQWLAERVGLGVPNAATAAGELYDSYRWWCTANGFADVQTSTALGRELKRRGLAGEVRRVGGRTARFWLGVQLTGAEL